MNLKTLWHDISCIGVDHSLDYTAIKQIILANQVAAVMIGIELCSLLFVFFYQKPALFYAGMLLLVLNLAVLYLNFRQYFLVVKYLLTVVSLFLFFVPQVYFAHPEAVQDTQLALPILICTLFTLLLFQSKETRFQGNLILGVHFFFILTFDQLMHWGCYQSFRQDTFSAAYLETKIPQIFLFFITVFCFSFLKDINLHFEEKLRHINVDLSLKNEEISASEDVLRSNLADLKKAKATIEAKNEELLQTNQNIKSSIKAAKAIQQAILPYEQKLKALLKDYFIIFRPKDVVSGDFYWLNELKPKYEQEQEIILASVDCTGHGVPGAFMSMIGNTLLDKIVRVWKITDPAKIIDCLHREVEMVLRQKDTGNTYGMDLCVVKWKRKRNNFFDFQFSGARSAGYYILPDKQGCKVMKGARKSVGGYQNERIQYETQCYDLPPQTLIYLGSDGFADQNNPKRKRFSSQKLKELITCQSNLALSQQKKGLENALHNFMEGAEQRDDILLIGFRLV